MFCYVRWTHLEFLEKFLIVAKFAQKRQKLPMSLKQDGFGDVVEKRVTSKRTLEFARQIVPCS